MTNGSELYLHHCCFTGHRPEKLHVSEAEVCVGLEREIRVAIADGYTTFISGVERGVDIWAAEIVIRLREEGAPLLLIAANPFPGYEKTWPPEWLERYGAVIERADRTEYISPCDNPLCFTLRDRWMVDHSSRVIAVFNGTPGGTKKTVDYARQKGVPVVFA